MSRYNDKNFMNFRCHLVELWCQTLTLIFSSHKSRFIQKNTGTFLYVQKTSGIFVTQKNIQKNTGTFLYLQKTPGIFLYVQNNTCMNLPYKIIPVCVQGRPKWQHCLFHFPTQISLPHPVQYCENLSTCFTKNYNLSNTGT